MNRRTFLILSLVTIAVALFQWRQQSQLATRETALRGELTQLKALHAQSPDTRSATSRDTPLPAAGFSPEQLVEDIINLAPFIHGETAMQSREEVEAQQKKALAILAQIAGFSPAQLKQAYENLMASSASDAMKSELREPILVRIAETEPAWALAQSLKMVGHRVFLSDILKVWAAKDPTAARSWIEAAHKDGTLASFGGPFVNSLLAEVAGAQAATDPMSTLDQLPALSPEAQRKAITSMAHSLKTPEDRRSALERIAQGDQMQLQHFVSALGENAGFDTSRAALDTAQLSPQAHDIAAAALAATGIGPQTPERAAWLMNNLRGKDPEPLREFICAWTGADFNATATWMKNLPAGEPRDTAVAAFAGQVATAEPESAADWAATIQAPKTRAQALQKIFATWPDKAAATAYYTAKGWTVD